MTLAECSILWKSLSVNSTVEPWRCVAGFIRPRSLMMILKGGASTITKTIQKKNLMMKERQWQKIIIGRK